MISSFVGMIQICVLLSGALKQTSPFVVAFFVSSSTMPNSAKFCAHAAADMHTVLANAARKDDRIGSAQLDQVRAQVVPDRTDKHIECSFARVLPPAAASSKSRTSPLKPLSPNRPLFSANWCNTCSSDCPVACITKGKANGSKSPTRLFCGNPVCGSCPCYWRHSFRDEWPSRNSSRRGDMR